MKNVTFIKKVYIVQCYALTSFSHHVFRSELTYVCHKNSADVNLTQYYHNVNLDTKNSMTKSISDFYWIQRMLRRMQTDMQ